MNLLHIFIYFYSCNHEPVDEIFRQKYLHKATPNKFIDLQTFYQNLAQTIFFQQVLGYDVFY